MQHRVVRSLASHSSEPPLTDTLKSYSSKNRRFATVEKDFRDFLSEAKQQPSNAAPEDDGIEDMFVDTRMGKEWGGPMRGGRHLEPTRFGDWERQGRASDF